MSTLTVSNVSDGTLSIPTTYVTNGSAKAWINFNGTGTIAARDSLNVSSLTDNGTGDYTVNFTNAFAAADYSVSVSGSANVFPTGTTGIAAASTSIENYSIAGSPVDNSQMCFSGHGDLA